MSRGRPRRASTVGLRPALLRWKRAAISRLDRSPSVFPLEARLRGHRDLAVSPATELVLEGYPRSGNTFAVAAFTLAQPGPVSLAHHLHAPAQVLLAARRAIPCVVLVREPAGAVISRMIRRPFETARSALTEWSLFHEAVLPALDCVVVASFEQLTTDFGAVIDRVNLKFGTGFARFAHDADSERRAFERVEEMERADSGGDAVRETHVARPSAARSAAKETLRAEFDEPALAALRARADALYETYLVAAGRNDGLGAP